MSDQVIKVPIGGALLLHGLGHGGAPGALEPGPRVHTVAALGMDIAALDAQLWLRTPPKPCS